MKYLEFDTLEPPQAGDLKSRFDLSNHGLIHLDRVFWNLPAAALIEEATFRKEGHLAHGGPLVVNTGKWSARAARTSTSSARTRPRTGSGGASTTGRSIRTSTRR